MAEADVKQFEILRKTYKDAKKASKEAARTSKAVKGLGGKRSRMEALASIPGKRAAKAELDALREQTIALEKMLAFAISRVNGAEQEPVATKFKAGKAGKPKVEQKTKKGAKVL